MILIFFIENIQLYILQKKSVIVHVSIDDTHNLDIMDRSIFYENNLIRKILNFSLIFQMSV